MPDPASLRIPRYTDEQLYALALYLYSLEPPENPYAPKTDAERERTTRGEKVFATAGCAKCHVPNQGYTNNMSPPLDVSMVPGRIACGISKLGMTLLTYGLAEEVRSHNIAVNSLWPVTIIESQASINWGLGSRERWRKPDILVDCVLRLVQKEPAALTGQALLDEEFLRSEGVTDFSSYACVPGTNPPRMTWALDWSSGC